MPLSEGHSHCFPGQTAAGQLLLVSPGTTTPRTHPRKGLPIAVALSAHDTLSCFRDAFREAGDKPGGALATFQNSALQEGNKVCTPRRFWGTGCMSERIRPPQNLPTTIHQVSSMQNLKKVRDPRNAENIGKQAERKSRSRTSERLQLQDCSNQETLYAETASWCMSFKFCTNSWLVAKLLLTMLVLWH